MKTDLVKGFNDYTGEDALKRAEVRKLLVETFEKYGFEPAETPIIESESFVKGENKQDEAVSDIYKLKDKGKRKLALRYEFTFQLKRIAKNKKLPYKRYQIGEVFRDEPVSGNRFRQFTQCDVDTIGSSNIIMRDEAEILALTKEVFDKIGIKIDILINNRKLLSAILEIFGLENELKRKNIISAIDELDKRDKKEIRKKLPKELQDYFTQLASTLRLNDFDKLKEYYIGLCKNKKMKYEDTSFAKAENEIIELKKYCKLYGVNVLFSPTIVRGLSYYTGSVFELKTSGMKESVGGGGTYKIEGKNATGISFGLDRVAQIANLKLQKEKFLVVSLEQDEEAIKIIRILRKQGKNVSIFYGKPSKALEFANGYNYGNVIFVGEKEVQAKRYKVKNMITGKSKGIKLR